MSLGLIGKKCGMTRIFTEDGNSIPVTVIDVSSNRVAQIKNEENDGYSSLQIAFGERKLRNITKSAIGHFAKAGIEPASHLHEFRVSSENLNEYNLGDAIPVTLFQEGQVVDVAGVSRGKGFAGVIKRYHFAMQDATHGNSLSHRAPGSIGQCQTPGRVFKGKKMAGQMGNVSCTVQAQKIVRIDEERQLIMVKGGVPGAPSGIVIIKQSVKNKEVA